VNRPNSQLIHADESETARFGHSDLLTIALAVALLTHEKAPKYKGISIRISAESGNRSASI
jgi:hypothetical protein